MCPKHLQSDQGCIAGKKMLHVHGYSFPGHRGGSWSRRPMQMGVSEYGGLPVQPPGRRKIDQSTHWARVSSLKYTPNTMEAIALRMEAIAALRLEAIAPKLVRV